ncbi:MAG TPA: TlpA disulfide reductase family protein [Bacteroidales bacterium]|nr:TlpA disulfide reductase family protein [Bacteroidales bacterium]
MGTIKNFEKYYDENKNIGIIINDIVTGEQVYYYADIDSSGKFFISFPLLNAQDILFSYLQKWFGFAIGPKDTLILNFDADNFPESMQFTGKNKDAEQKFRFRIYENQNLDQNYEENNDRFQSSLKLLPYKQWLDSAYQRKLALINKYCSENNVNENIALNIKQSDELSYYRNLMHNQYFLKGNNDSLSRAILKSFVMDNSYLSNSRLMFFIGDLCNYYVFKSFPSVFEKEDLINSVKKELGFSLGQFSEADREQLRFNCFLATINDVGNNIVRDLLISQRLFQTYKRSNIDLINRTNIEFITDTIIRKRLLAQVNKLKSLEANLNSLHLEENDGDLLLESLKQRYKNKILYIDFWGTWCGPCFGELKKSEELKKRQPFKNIVFVYLCCNSDKDSWEKKIRELKISGEHILLNSTQTKDLYLKFAISGIPRFVLIDKQGKIVNYHAPRPTNEEALLKEINKLHN